MIEARAQVVSNTIAPLLDFANKNAEQAVLRGADASAFLHARYMISHFIKGEFHAWETQREAKISRAIYAYTKRQKGRISGDEVSDAYGLKRTDAAALERGGLYEQWVKDHSRRAPIRASGKAGQGTRTRGGAVQVKGYRRKMRQRALQIFTRTHRDLAQEAAIPVQRALEVLVTKGRMPRRGELLKGLPR